MLTIFKFLQVTVGGLYKALLAAAAFIETEKSAASIWQESCLLFDEVLSRIPGPHSGSSALDNGTKSAPADRGK